MCFHRPHAYGGQRMDREPTSFVFMELSILPHVLLFQVYIFWPVPDFLTAKNCWFPNSGLSAGSFRGILILLIKENARQKRNHWFKLKNKKSIEYFYQPLDFFNFVKSTLNINLRLWLCHLFSTDSQYGFDVKLLVIKVNYISLQAGFQ